MKSGITLIALVITIIVLILLAMITLAMLTGENGLLSKSLEAKIANEKAEIQDRAETEVLASIGNNGKINWDKLKDNLASNFEMNKDEITNKGTEPSDGLKFTVEKNKRNYNVDIDEKGKVTVTYEGEVAKVTTTPSTEPEEKIEISHEIQTEKAEEKEIPIPTGGEIKTDRNGEKFPIPSGFTYQEGNVSDGAVVTATVDGSEFVWVPVKKVIAESEKTAIQKEKLTTAKIIITAKPEKDIKEITNETESNIEKISNTEYKITENGEYKFKVTTKLGKSEEYIVNVEKIETEENKAMAVVDPTDEENYRGILYSFATYAYGPGSRVKSGCTTTAFTSSPKGAREPAFLNNSTYGDLNKKNNGRVTEVGLKAEYKSMIESVEKYGGFYVGRYETSLNENKVQSKKDQTPMDGTTGSGNSWWGMYEKEKNYASDNGLSSSVGSSMIWGSQWDAMLNWILKGSDASKVLRSAENHPIAKTGNSSEDVLSRIYDLTENIHEWTLEAVGTTDRVWRGGASRWNGCAATRTEGR